MSHCFQQRNFTVMNQWDGREEKESGKDRGRDCPLPKGKKYKFWPWQSSLTCEGFLAHATFFSLFVLFSPLTLWGQVCVVGVVSNEIQKRASVGMATRTLCIIITVNFRKNTLQNFWKMDVMILYLCYLHLILTWKLHEGRGSVLSHCWIRHA